MTLGYNVITKRITTNLCDEPQGVSLFEKVVQWFDRLCELNDIKHNDLGSMIAVIAAEKAINPAVEYLSALSWDRTPRFAAVASCLRGSAPAVAEAAMRMFLIELCAAADHAQRSPHDPQFDTVVVLQGPQGIGKSRFWRELMPPELAPFFRGGRSLSPGDKDSLLAALSALVVELGELDATFRRADVAALKAFLSLDADQIRRPYARGHEQMQRRTLFVGTVNAPEFLVDDTGNRRFVPAPVDSIDFATLKGIAIEQVLAEAWHRYLMGEQWWPTLAEQQLIAPARAAHERMRPGDERLLMHYDFSTLPDPLPVGWEKGAVPGIRALTATQITAEIGLDGADRGDTTAVGIALTRINQDQTGRPRRVECGRLRLWAVPTADVARLV